MRKWYTLISQIVNILYKTGTGWWGQVIKKVRNNQEECDPITCGKCFDRNCGHRKLNILCSPGFDAGQSG